MADSNASYQKMEEGQQEGPMAPPFPLSDLDSKKEQLLKGLNDGQAAEMEAKYGLNEVPEKKTPLWKLFLKQFTGPMQIMIESAAILCLINKSMTDFTIILILLMTNGTLGFFEEKNAQASVDALKAGLEKQMPVKRNGKFSSMPVVKLVPGDIVFMRGGDIIPADCYYLEGDPCQVDEAALTGESLPVKCPRKDEADKFVDEQGHQQTKVKPYSGRLMYSGAILKVGECQAVVGYTGVNTLIGEAAKAIQEAGGHEVGVFEQKIINAAKVLIVTTAVVVAGLFAYMLGVQKAKFASVLEMCISLVIASVPVALPMVMKVTLSLGAKEMADEGGIVTHLTALEEIASMKVLCSDKTGTLTTAQMTVYYDNNAKAFNGFTAKQVLEFGSIASNEANKDDPIDSAVLRAYTEMVGAGNVDDAVQQRTGKFTLDKEGFDGFNPIVKRTCARVTSSDGKKYLVAKGMVDVILATDPSDEGKEQWKVDNFDAISKEVKAADATLGMSGFKTLAVMVREGTGPHQFAGILPIMDPPRKDTKDTIASIKASGVAVKMITGDHHNIAKQLAAQIELGVDIRTPADLATAKNAAEKEHLALQTDGFAKVKPIDKHTVVSTLQHVGLVVGMTGDGVNDAPALAQAQIGVAVHGATDAAKSAGDIVLTRDGLSPIFTAIQISRRIFKRLKSYVIYRIGITVQVVFFLATLAMVWNLTFKPLYIILLALFHDLQIVTIAYDKQVAGKKPETPTVTGLLLQSWSMGFLMFLQSILIVGYGHLFLSDTFKAGYLESMKGESGSELNGYVETTLFLQISNSSAILILSARTVGFFFTTFPAWQLLVSTAIGQVLINILVLCNPCLNLVTKMVPMDVACIWVYDVAWLLVLDIVKMIAGAIWEKYKPANVDANPALVHEQKQARASRRASNRIGTNVAVVAAGAHADKGGEMKKRLSTRNSVSK
jgi:H+-transporting ATPase